MNDETEELNKRQWQDFFQGYSADWNQLYEGTSYDSYGKRFRAKYAMDFVDKYISSGKRVLDIGCGTGWVSCALARKGYKVTGVDFSEKMLEVADKNAHQMGVDSQCTFILGEIDKLKIKESQFDAIIALGYLEYILDPQPVVSEMYRLLAPSGIVVAQIWNRIRMVHLLNFKDGPGRIANPHVVYLKILKWIQMVRKSDVGHPGSSGLKQPGLMRKWYTPSMLDRTMHQAGFLKHEHMGHLFSGLKYGDRLIFSDKTTMLLENGLVWLSQLILFKKMQLLGENYIAVYHRPK
jgi:ubiquinone/menaquinone biosynthesis C-methylase UbiE